MGGACGKQDGEVISSIPKPKEIAPEEDKSWMAVICRLIHQDDEQHEINVRRCEKIGSSVKRELKAAVVLEVLFGGVHAFLDLRWEDLEVQDGATIYVNFLPPFAGVLEGHDDNVLSLVSLGNHRFASTGKDATVRVWSVEDGRGECTMNLTGHEKGVTDVANVDGNVFVSCSRDATLRVWDVPKEGTSTLIRRDPFKAVLGVGECKAVFRGHTNSVSTICHLGDGRLATGSRDQTIHIWDTSREEKYCVEKFWQAKCWVISMAALPDNRLASASGDLGVKVWDVETGRCVAVLGEHRAAVRCVEDLGDGRLASGSDDGTARIWGGMTLNEGGKCLRVLKGHTGFVISLSSFENGTMLATGSYDTTIRVWETVTGDCMRILRGHTTYVTALAGLNKGMLASVAQSTGIRIWNLKEDGEEVPFEEHPDSQLDDEPVGAAGPWYQGVLTLRRDSAM